MAARYSLFRVQVYHSRLGGRDRGVWCYPAREFGQRLVEDITASFSLFFSLAREELSTGLSFAGGLSPPFSLRCVYLVP